MWWRRQILKPKLLNFQKKIAQNDFPSDGLVLIYDDIRYGESLGRTAKFPRDSYAFKWADETRETTLQGSSGAPQGPALSIRWPSSIR